MWQIISEVITQYICAIISMIGVFLFSNIILNKKLQNLLNLRNILSLIISAIIYTVINIYFQTTLKSFFMMITILILYKYIFKEKFKKTIFMTVMYTLILLLVDLFVLLVVTKILNMSKEFCYDTFAGSVIGNIITQFIMITIAITLKKIFIYLLDNKITTSTKIIIISILTSLCSIMFLYAIVREFRLSNDIYLYLITIIVLLVALLSLIKQTIQNNRLLNEYDKLLEFMTTYENEIENQRILRHEVKNEFRTIRAKICDKQNNKEIIEYIDEIVNDKYKMDKEKYAKFGYLPPNGIKGLCYFKTQEAEDKGIKVNLNISKRIKNSNVYKLTIKDQRDFGRILGVFLDNAIEASKDSKKKQLGIEGYVNSNQEFKMIITNTYNNKIDKSKIGIDKFSTKGKNRGHGLLLTKQLTEKNNKFKIQTNIQENIYIQTIEIKNAVRK